MDFSMKRAVATLLLLLAGSWALPVAGFARAADTGTVNGTVYSGGTGDALVKAGVEVIGTGKTVFTGVDGDYSVVLPAGTYKLRFFSDGFSDQTEEVTIAAGETVEKTVAISPVGNDLGTVTTVAGADSIDVQQAMEERKASSSIADLVSLKEIRDDVASSTEGVTRRVVGVQVGDNGVLVVRGLGDRYSASSLNNSQLPTPDPERKSVPMNIIPANLLQSIKVLKTYTPDQPGEFSGGIIRLDTVDMPAKGSLSLSYAMGFNTETTGKDFYTYPGRGLDVLGFGADGRGLPSIVPAGQRVLPGNIFEAGGLSRDQLQQIGRSFDNRFTPEVVTGRPTSSLNISGGRSFSFWGDDKFGFVAALAYKNDVATADEVRRTYGLGQDSALSTLTDYDYKTSSNIVRLGGTVNLSYEPNNNNKFFLKNFVSNQATNEARVFTGFNEDRGNDLRDTRLRYSVERIYSSQFSGRHNLSLLQGWIVNWRFTYSRAILDEPDLREALYEKPTGSSDFTLLDQNQSLFHLFNKMHENMREPGLDLEKFWFGKGVTISTKVGGVYNNRDRQFDSRRFRFVPRFLQNVDLTQDPEQLLGGENIRPDNGFEIQETTRSTDTYTGRQDITAGYAMGDLTWGRWRFVGGARVERSIQRVLTFEPFKLNSIAENANLDNTDWLPSIGGTYAIVPEKMLLRAAFSRTVTRPQFRELSPFEFTDVTGGRSVVGNPDLKRTLITNYDLRYEWYPRPGELFAASYFYKKLDDPIETIVEAGANLRSSFTNADKAINQGIELEARKGFDFFGERWKSLQMSANYTFVSSSVTLTPEQAPIVTTLDRALVGQARHIFNTTLSYELPRVGVETRALFNYTGDRITDVGTFGIPNIIEKGRPTLDASFVKKFGGERLPWAIEFQMENLLNRPLDVRQGNQAFQVYRQGREFSLGVSYNFF